MAFVVMWRVITHRGVCVAFVVMWRVITHRGVCGVCGNVESDYAQRCVCVAFVVMWRVVTHRGVCVCVCVARKGARGAVQGIWT